jgi:RNA polymerase sigma factor (sigma-70 family)
MQTEELYEAYTHFVLKYREAVWRVCFNYANGDVAKSKDLVQEVCLVLWLRFDRLRVEARPEEQYAWLMLVTHSVLHNLHRRRRPTMQEIDQMLEESLTEEADADAEMLKEMLEHLDAEDQYLIGLELKGYRRNEMAGFLGLKTSTLNGRMERIINKLKLIKELIDKEEI